jgi:hypothetical protein
VEILENWVTRLPTERTHCHASLTNVDQVIEFIFKRNRSAFAAYKKSKGFDEIKSRFVKELSSVGAGLRLGGFPQNYVPGLSYQVGMTGESLRGMRSSGNFPADWLAEASRHFNMIKMLNTSAGRLQLSVDESKQFLRTVLGGALDKLLAVAADPRHVHTMDKIKGAIKAEVEAVFQQRLKERLDCQLAAGRPLSPAKNKGQFGSSCQDSHQTAGTGSYVGLVSTTSGPNMPGSSQNTSDQFVHLPVKSSSPEPAVDLADDFSMPDLAAAKLTPPPASGQTGDASPQLGAPVVRVVAAAELSRSPASNLSVIKYASQPAGSINREQPVPNEHLSPPSCVNNALLSSCQSINQPPSIVDLLSEVNCPVDNCGASFRQCCGSGFGSAWIRNFLSDQELFVGSGSGTRGFGTGSGTRGSGSGSESKTGWKHA